VFGRPVRILFIFSRNPLNLIMQSARSANVYPPSGTRRKRSRAAGKNPAPVPRPRRRRNRTTRRPRVSPGVMSSGYPVFRKRALSKRAVQGAGNVMLSAKPFGMGAQNRTVGPRRYKRVENDEFVATILSAGTGANFANTAYPVNPGNATTFPWLSGEAQQWEKYYFEYLEFYFEHDVSAFANAGTTGKVIISFDYDAADSPPTTKSQMLDTEPHADGMPNEDFGIFMEPDDLSGRTDLHYVRLAGLPGGADIRLYDVGNLNIATQGITGNSTELGELHVRYACVFEVPVLESDGKAAPANNQVTWLQSSASEAAGATTVATQLALATTTVNGLSAVNTGGSVVLPAGNYIADFSACSFNSGGTGDGIIVDFQQNSVTLYTAALARPQQSTLVADGSNNMSASGSVFFSSTGAATSAIRLMITTTYSAGAETMAGSLRLVAV